VGGLELTTTVVGDWILATSPASDLLVHMPTGANIRSQRSELFGYVDGRVFAVHDGVASWVGPTGQRTPIVTIPGADAMALSQRYAVGIVDRGQLCRVEIGTSASHCTDDRVVANIRQYVVTDHGTVWAMTDKQLWRWLPPEPMTLIESNIPFRVVVSSEDRWIAASNDALVILGEQPSKPIAIPPYRMLAGGTQGRVVTTTPNGTIVVIDLETGMSYELLLGNVRATAVPRMTDREIGFSSVDAVWTIPTDVPTEPAALRAWLATITNALPVADSDAVVFPALR
jgi:hypothetical protein